MFLHLINILINYLIHGFINVKTGFSQYSFSSLYKNYSFDYFFNWFKKTTKNSLQGFCIASNIKIPG